MAAAAELNWDVALAWVDDRADYGEIRIVALAPIGDRLFFVAFVDRVDARRIISLRQANRREVHHYVSTTQEDRDQDADN
ncbi:MAG: BrnT family toxin [Synechococcaceae cyanobacterium]